MKPCPACTELIGDDEFACNEDCARITQANAQRDEEMSLLAIARRFVASGHVDQLVKSRREKLNDLSMQADGTLFGDIPTRLNILRNLRLKIYGDLVKLLHAAKVHAGDPACPTPADLRAQATTWLAVELSYIAEELAVAAEAIPLAVPPTI